MNFKYFIFLLFFLTLKNQIKAQDFSDRWVFGFGAAGSLYSEKDASKVGFRYSSQFPQFSLARYMFKNVTFAGAISTSISQDRKYTTLDGEVRYDFGTSENTLSIYGLIGGSLVDSKDYVTPFINFGGGGTLWLSDRIGLHGQMIYKVNYYNVSKQGSHIFASGSIVYRFSLNGNSNKARNVKRDSPRKRIWNMKH